STNRRNSTGRPVTRNARPATTPSRRVATGPATDTTIVSRTGRRKRAGSVGAGLDERVAARPPEAVRVVRRRLPVRGGDQQQLREPEDRDQPRQHPAPERLEP